LKLVNSSDRFLRCWIEQQLHRQAACFGIDLLGFSIRSNLFHLILRSRPDVVSAWDDMEVARRWLMHCPLRKDSDGMAAEPSPMELNTIVNDPLRLKTIRVRLNDIGWRMRCLSQHIAIRANRDDHENGRFWQGCFRSVRLVDEAAVLACAAYVDLNPIRAAMAETLEQSDFTSVQRRIQSLTQQLGDGREAIEQRVADSPVNPGEQNSCAAADSPIATIISQNADNPDHQIDPFASDSVSVVRLADRFLSPLSINERHDAIGPALNRTGDRCSDKGFLPIPLLD
jgi:hypothetical protein